VVKAINIFSLSRISCEYFRFNGIYIFFRSCVCLARRRERDEKECVMGRSNVWFDWVQIAFHIEEGGEKDDREQFYGLLLLSSNAETREWSRPKTKEATWSSSRQKQSRCLFLERMKKVEWRRQINVIKSKWGRSEKKFFRKRKRRRKKVKKSDSWLIFLSLDFQWASSRKRRKKYLLQIKNLIIFLVLFRFFFSYRRRQSRCEKKKNRKIFIWKFLEKQTRRRKFFSTKRRRKKV
jgi:hypothetical protein